MNKTKISNWPDLHLSGSKRTNIHYSDWLDDWFVGYGKDESCCFEGSWWDMICFARNVLASENTKIAAPEFYHPEWDNENYVGEAQPYDFVGEEAEGMTNADNIRTMTDEELAEWIIKHDCHSFLYGYDPKDAVLDWLKQEADG